MSSFRKIEAESDCLDMTGSLFRSLNDGPLGRTYSEFELKIKEIGRIVPLDSAVEIKTRSACSTIDMLAITSQLWITQTSKLV